MGTEGPGSLSFPLSQLALPELFHSRILTEELGNLEARRGEIDRNFLQLRDFGLKKPDFFDGRSSLHAIEKLQIELMGLFH